MKKLVYLFTMITTICFCSCGNCTKSVESEDTLSCDTVLVVDTIDTLSVDTCG